MSALQVAEASFALFRAELRLARSSAVVADLALLCADFFRRRCLALGERG